MYKLKISEVRIAQEMTDVVMYLCEIFLPPKLIFFWLKSKNPAFFHKETGGKKKKIMKSLYIYMFIKLYIVKIRNNIEY